MREIYLADTDETLLWNMMIQGNEKAFEKLYSNYYNSMFHYGMCYSFDQNLVKDCIQDVFIKIYNNRSLKNVQYVQAYLLRSLRNQIFNQLSLDKDYSLEEVSFEFSMDDSMLENLFSKDDNELQVGKQIRTALQSLTNNQKNVLYLRYVKNLTFKEIAEILNVQSQSVQNQLSRTLINLREKLSLPPR